MPASPPSAAPHDAPRTPRSVDSPDLRQAGREWLSLALIDARNRTLQLLAACDDARRAAAPASASDALGATPPLWLAGHIGWFAEWWIGRNTQRAFGADCPARPTRLASVEPAADSWWNPALRPRAARAQAGLPDLAQTKDYLLATLESTLDLLDKAAETDPALYFYRLALLHEDRCAEQLLVLAQTLGLPLRIEAPPVAAARSPLVMPATVWTLGLADAGFAWAQERGQQVVSVPAFEIDAQPVSWAQYIEFVDDGGYDDPAHWHADGWRWLQGQAEGRRAPRHVEQIGAARAGRTASGGSVLQRRFGATVRIAGQHSAVHLSWWEADAWARWAGRRIATEVEWEIAAHTAQRRGFRWGDVHEWTAGTLQPWPGFRPDPWSAGGAFDPLAAFGVARVLRGASFATAPRLRAARRRGFARPGHDAGFIGFRTCSI